MLPVLPSPTARAHRRRASAAMLLAGALLATSCGTTDDSSPRPTDASTAPSTAMPLASVATGGGRVELVALWRQDGITRMVVSGTADDGADGFGLTGRFGPADAAMRSALLIAPDGTTAYRALHAPDGPDRCLCTVNLSVATSRTLAYADFAVPSDVTEVVVLGDASPSLGRHRIADAPPDFAAAGYRWPDAPPPAPGGTPFVAADATAPVRRTAELADGSPLPADVDPDAAYDAVALPWDVVFAANSWSITPAARAQIDAALPMLRALPAQTTVVVMGYTDTQGPADANRALSLRRAEVVADALRPRLSGTTVKVEAHGGGVADAVVPDVDAQGRAIRPGQATNRRVEIQVPRTAVPTSTTRPADGPGPGEARRISGPPGDVATVEVPLGAPNDERVQVGIERVEHDADLGLMRIDLRLDLLSARAAARSSTRGGEVLAGAGTSNNTGARQLRLVDPITGMRTLPAGADGAGCLCADETTPELVGGRPEQLSVWFAAAPDARTVSLLIPRAGLLRDLPVTRS